VLFRTREEPSRGAFGEQVIGSLLAEGAGQVVKAAG